MTEEKDTFQYKWDHSSNMDRIIYCINWMIIMPIIIGLVIAAVLMAVVK